MTVKYAWIGLGVMGFPMAGHLAAKSGAEVAVFNRSAEKAKKWVALHGSRSADTPKSVAEGADIVFACVGNDNDLRQVTTGPDGAFHSMKKGSVFVDHTTASADVARELHDIALEQGFGFIDAPVSGGQAGAEKGQLTVMCGGEEDATSSQNPQSCIMPACGLLGKTGSGQLAKMCNQIAIAGVVQGLAECVHFGMNAGLDMEAVVDVIAKGAAGSWQMENRHKTMIANKFDFGFAVDWMRKDLGICLAEARRNASHLPVTALVDQFYSEVQKMGGNRWDTSSLVARLAR